MVVTKDAKPKVATRQMKEAKFEHAVRQNVYEERQNQLRWQSKLGDEQMTTEDRSKVLADRNKAWNVYKVRTGLHTCAFPSNFLWLPLRLTVEKRLSYASFIILLFFMLCYFINLLFCTFKPFASVWQMLNMEKI